MIKIQLCNSSIVSFVISLPFILLFVSIHDIPSDLVFITYLLYFYFLVFLFIYCFDTPNILEDDSTALSLTKTIECEYICIYFLMLDFLTIAINIF